MPHRLHLISELFLIDCIFDCSAAAELATVSFAPPFAFGVHAPTYFRLGGKLSPLAPFFLLERQNSCTSSSWLFPMVFFLNCSTPFFLFGVGRLVLSLRYSSLASVSPGWVCLRRVPLSRRNTYSILLLLKVIGTRLLMKISCKGDRPPPLPQLNRGWVRQIGDIFFFVISAFLF